MLEIGRLRDGSDCFELGCVERETTPKPAMKLGILLHLAVLSLLKITTTIDNLGVEWCRSTVQNWV